MDAPSLVSAWDALVQQLCSVFTESTAHTWSQIALGWVLNRGSATVTAIFRTLGNAADRHWTVYEKFFYRAAWCLSTLCTVLLQRVVYPLLLEAAQGKQARSWPIWPSTTPPPAARANTGPTPAGSRMPRPPDLVIAAP